MTRLVLTTLTALALCLAGCSCEETTEPGLDGGGDPMDSGMVDAGRVEVPDATVRPDAPGSELCPDGGCACSNGIDDDGDGLVDGLDPECTGPFDDDEGSFATGIPGDNRDPVWQDCFYDGNSGAGDDGCRYHTDCLTGDAPPEDGRCEVAESCVEFCRARTPNGCDCFGCCEVTLETGDTVMVAINDRCSLDNIEDEDLCPRCVQSAECMNECGTCELCPGRELEDLPPECYPDDAGVPMYMCEDGVTCASDGDCAVGEFCSLGCCLEAPI